MRLVWATDIPLDSAKEAAQRRFLDALAAAAPDAVLVGGTSARPSRWGSTRRGSSTSFGEAAVARPDRRVTVLCGHTHGVVVADILPNLRVRTGSAQYGKPSVQDAWEVE